MGCEREKHTVLEEESGKSLGLVEGVLARERDGGRAIWEEPTVLEEGLREREELSSAWEEEWYD